MKILIRITTAVFLIAAIVIAAVEILHTPGERNNSLTKPTPMNSLVEVARPRRQDFTMSYQWFGKVESREKVDIIVLKFALIDSVNADDEAFVKKGTSLFTLADPMIDNRLATVKKKMISLQEQATIFERNISIKKDSVTQKPVNQEELIAAKDSLAGLQAELESAKQEIRFLRDAVHIRATADGIFTNRKVSAGQIVKKGGKLAEIVSVKSLRISATLFPPKNIKLKGKRAIINLADGDSISGTVMKELPQRTAEGATTVWIEGPEINRRLYSGETINGTLILSQHKAALSIPQSAIVRDEKERAYIFVKDSSDYHRTPVKTGIVSNSRVEIMSGLKEGDEVVIRGAYELFYQDFNKIYKVTD